MLHMLTGRFALLLDQLGDSMRMRELQNAYIEFVYSKQNARLLDIRHTRLARARSQILGSAHVSVAAAAHGLQATWVGGQALSLPRILALARPLRPVRVRACHGEEAAGGQAGQRSGAAAAEIEWKWLGRRARTHVFQRLVPHTVPLWVTPQVGYTHTHT